MNTKNLLKSLDNFNSNKYLLGISLLMLNIGSKYLIVDLSNSTQQLLKLKIIRRFTIFSIFFIGTRNVSTSIILTGFFIIFSEGLFNENSKYFILPKKMKDKKDISEDEYKYAQEIVKKYEEQDNNEEKVIKENMKNKKIEIYKKMKNEI